MTPSDVPAGAGDGVLPERHDVTTRKRHRCPPWRTPGEAIRLFASGVTARSALPIALLVGTILSAVNDGAALLAGQFTFSVGVKVVVNYLIPFFVASAGFLSAGRSE